MERLTPQQRLKIVQLYIYYIYGVHNRLTERTIRHTIGKLENNLTLLDEDRRPGRIDSAPISTTWPILWHYLGDFECRKLKPVISTTFDFNKTALHVIQPVKQWLYCVVVSVSNLSLVSDRWIGLQDRVISNLWTFICGGM